MNKFNNPRLTNTTVSGTGVKHPMRPHVILGDPENGFIRGDLLDANAVIKLIKNAAKAIGALEELEQSNWIDDNAKTEEPAEETVGVLQPGEVGFVVAEGEKILAFNDAGTAKGVLYTDDNVNYTLYIKNNSAFGKTVQEAYQANYFERVTLQGSTEGTVNYSTVSGLTIKNATMSA